MEGNINNEKFCKLLLMKKKKRKKGLSVKNCQQGHLLPYMFLTPPVFSGKKFSRLCEKIFLAGSAFTARLIFTHGTHINLRDLVTFITRCNNMITQRSVIFMTHSIARSMVRE